MTDGTRKRIVDATRQLIETTGLSRVTIKEIARAVGVTEGALYRHFDTKTAIIFAVVQEHLPALRETLVNHTPGTGTVRASLEAIALASLQYYAQLIPLSASFLADAELLTQFQGMMQEASGGPDRIFEHVAAYLQGEQEQGRVHPLASVSRAAALLLGACFQHAYLRRLLGSDASAADDQQFAMEIVETLMVGLDASSR